METLLIIVFIFFLSCEKTPWPSPFHLCPFSLQFLKYQVCMFWINMKCLFLLIIRINLKQRKDKGSFWNVPQRSQQCLVTLNPSLNILLSIYQIIPLLIPGFTITYSHILARIYCQMKLVCLCLLTSFCYGISTL